MSEIVDGIFFFMFVQGRLIQGPPKPKEKSETREILPWGTEMVNEIFFCIF
jgi:hypothetical protein